MSSRIPARMTYNRLGPFRKRRVAAFRKRGYAFGLAVVVRSEAAAEAPFGRTACPRTGGQSRIWGLEGDVNAVIDRAQSK